MASDVPGPLAVGMRTLILQNCLFQNEMVLISGMPSTRISARGTARVYPIG